MLTCDRHPDELICECKENQWKHLPIKARQVVIETTNKTLGIKKPFAEWLDLVKMRILGYTIKKKGEVMKI